MAGAPSAAGSLFEQTNLWRAKAKRRIGPALAASIKSMSECVDNESGAKSYLINRQVHTDAVNFGTRISLVSTSYTPP